MEAVETKTFLLALTKMGKLKRMSLEEFGAQRRGGKGVIALKIEEDDVVSYLLPATEDDHLLCFTTLGKCHILKVSDIPELGRYAKGILVSKLMELENEERVAAVVSVSSFPEGLEVVMLTKQGMIKKTELSKFARPRAGGIKAVTIHEGDELSGARISDGKSSILVATKSGRAIRFDETLVRSTGRGASGVKAMRLKEGDGVAGFLVGNDQSSAVTVTEGGFGKRTPMSKYRSSGRGGQGVTNIKSIEKTGAVVALVGAGGEDELLVGSSHGKAIVIKAQDIRETGRASTGVRIMRLDEGDKVVVAEKTG
ncbi:MAG: DNA gyrase C-terminal beta-propeller domain-containing protein [Candidatus Eisenbacteria bacterium]|nr:DNA gyrase C-terminal beta-propeller domain-containing protein [Candidatus Eisenbacteria bacterium]